MKGRIGNYSNPLSGSLWYAKLMQTVVALGLSVAITAARRADERSREQKREPSRRSEPLTQSMTGPLSIFRI